MSIYNRQGTYRNNSSSKQLAAAVSQASKGCACYHTAATTPATDEEDWFIGLLCYCSLVQEKGYNLLKLCWTYSTTLSDVDKREKCYQWIHQKILHTHFSTYRLTKPLIITQRCRVVSSFFSFFYCTKDHFWMVVQASV